MFKLKNKSNKITVIESRALIYFIISGTDLNTLASVKVNKCH